jgi:tRNA (cytidine32/uridine32-2'-O)-methyltransferase
MSEAASDQSWSDRIKIVLVNTSHPGNIGAAARAMKNMALSRLVLVSPDEFPSGVAVGRAAGAVDLLDKATVAGSLQEAVADCSLIIGTSARSRSIPWPMLTPEASASRLVAESTQHPVALVFGREASGLNNEELQQCHFHVQVPANPDYSSLNLGAAVMVLSYELHKAHLAALAGQPGQESERWDQPLASAEQVEHFYAHLERLLVAVDFHDPDNPRQLMQRLRRLYGRIRIDDMEMNILRGILTHIEQRIDSGSGR